MELLFFLSIAVIFCAFGVLNYHNVRQRAEILIDDIRRNQLAVQGPESPAESAQ